MAKPAEYRAHIRLDLYEALHQSAYEQDKTKPDIINEALRAYLDGTVAEDEKGRVRRRALREAARAIGTASTDDACGRAESIGLDAAHGIVCRLIDASSAGGARAS